MLAVVVAAAQPVFAQQGAPSADVEALNQRLFAAVRANDIATVRLVLTNGADPMAVDANGQTPAGIAVDRGYFEIAHHILGVRNQRQALNRRNGQDEIGTPPMAPAPAPVAALPASPGEERAPDVTWRDTAVPGQATEIPAARLSAPQQASSVIAPATMITGQSRAAQAAQRKAAETGSTSAKTSAKAKPGAASAAPQPANQQVSLVNLPALPAGAPNPFDPQNAEPASLPVLTSTTPTVPPESAAAAGKPRKTSSGNAISRFFGGITGVFGGGGS